MISQKRRHGTFAIQVEQDILLVDAKGPFNMETISDYQLALADAIDSFQGQPWQQIIIMREESIFTPEAVEEMVKVSNYRKARGLIFSAVVFIDSNARTLIEHQLKGIYQQTGISYQFFDDVDTARQLLANNMAQV